jgi:hypothetical protein
MVCAVDVTRSTLPAVTWSVKKVYDTSVRAGAAVAIDMTSQLTASAATSSHHQRPAPEAVAGPPAEPPAEPGGGPPPGTPSTRQPSGRRRAPPPRHRSRRPCGRAPLEVPLTRT